MNGFDAAFEKIIGVEGGYSNDPRDPGGETRFGIAKRSHPDVDIANLTLDQAKEIYRTEYWLRCRCDEIPYPLNLFTFDSAVNQGVETAIKLLQKGVGATVDGVIGEQTMTAINSTKLGDLSAMFMADRAMRYMGLPNFQIYGRGWYKRLFQIAMGA